MTAAKPSSAASRLAFLDHAGRRGVRIEPAAVAKAAASPPPVLRFRHLVTSKPRHPADYRLAWLVLTVRRLPPPAAARGDGEGAFGNNGLGDDRLMTLGRDRSRQRGAPR